MIFIALLTSPAEGLGVQKTALRPRLARNARRQSGPASTGSATGDVAAGRESHSQAFTGRSGRILPPERLALRGGGDIHSAEVDLGNGNKVMVRAYTDGSAVASSFTATCDGFELQWGIALGQMDAWVHPKTAQSGKFSALVPSGSRSHMGNAMRSALRANTPLLIDTKNLGTQDDTLWGVRFVIVESASGRLYPAGGMTLFSPLKEGVDTSYVIKPDYGSLEERLAKRQNLPLELDGDHDRDRHGTGSDCDGGADRDHSEALHVQPAHIERDHGTLARQVSGRILAFANGDPGRDLGGKGGDRGGRGGAQVADAPVIPDGSIVLSDMNFESGGQRARLVAFCPAPDGEGGGAGGPVTVRAFARELGASLAPLTMHWSVGVDSLGDWARPSDEMMPADSERHKDSVQTRFRAAASVPVSHGVEAEGWDQIQSLVQEIVMDLPSSVKALNFVLKSGDNWYKADGGGDFQICLPTQGMATVGGGGGAGGGTSRKYQPILDFEGRGGLALMERFQEAKAFLEGVAADDPEAWAAVFVWLRFSQVRQLAWQRKHNTRPHFLGLAIEDLSKTVAWKWRQADGSRRELLRQDSLCLPLSPFARTLSIARSLALYAPRHLKCMHARLYYILIHACMHIHRQVISTVPRGGGDGQAIRDYILVIMRKFEIKKRKGTWMEEWHQKLHNNSTPDDIYICEAYLEFLRTHGDHNAFYAHLLKHGIDRKRLQTYDRPILQEPHYFPSIRNGLSNELRKYLAILKSVHAGADLRRLVQTCKHVIGDDVCALAAASLEVSDPGNALGALSCAVDARHQIANRMVQEGDGTKVRDLLYLDLALESQSRLLVENALSQVPAAQLPLWLALAGESLLVTLRYSLGAGAGEMPAAEDGGENPWAALDRAAKKEYEELREALADFAVLLQAKGHDAAAWDQWAALWGAACVERVQRALGGLVDRQQALLQPAAEVLGHGIRQRSPDKKPEGWSVTMFTEEVVRGGMSFAVSALMRKLEAVIRAAGGLSAWQVVSPGLKTAGGVLRNVVLADVQEEEYMEPTVLLASKITGEEEIPPGVTAIITPDAVDVLSHVSVRARQLKVLLVSCFDQEALGAVAQLADANVQCAIAGDAVDVAASSPAAWSGAHAAPGAGTATAAGAGIHSAAGVDLKISEGFASKYCLHEEELVGEQTAQAGAKTNNLVALRKLLPPDIHTPASAVIPFGALVQTLEDRSNGAVRATFEAAVAKAMAGDLKRIGSSLTDIQQALVQLSEPMGMRDDVLAAMKKNAAGDVEWVRAFETIKRVWASTWNERAFIACRKADIDPRRIQMCVLLQKLVEAQYAFVLHSVNPTTSDVSEMYGEVVVGQGEALVGNAPGRAFGFACNKHGGAQPRVKSLPSKGLALWGSGWIFRSDSNAEDLPGFAGAGLFDSFPVVEHKTSVIGYRNEKLVSDPSFASSLMASLRDLAVAVEEKMGGVPQDIEGCYVDGQLYVVQTRPQVGLE